MNAKEFIKKFGWIVAERILKNSEGCDYLRLHGSYKFTHADLKKYIDAYDLVKLRGGLSEAKAIEQQYWNSGVGSAVIVSMELKQAITLLQEINE